MGAPIQATPAVVNGWVYIGAESGDFFALDISGQRDGWVVSAGPAVQSWALNTRVVTDPGVAYGMVFVGANDGILRAFDANTGIMTWSLALGALPSAPSIAEGVLYVGTAHGRVYALGSQTGAVLWIFNSWATSLAAPIVADGVLYFGSEVGNKLYALVEVEQSQRAQQPQEDGGIPR